MRQVLAEWMIVECVIALEEHAKAKTANNEAALAEMADRVTLSMKKNRSVNLRALTLTTQGFIRAS